MQGNGMPIFKKLVGILKGWKKKGKNVFNVFLLGVQNLCILTHFQIKLVTPQPNYKHNQFCYILKYKVQCQKIL